MTITDRLETGDATITGNATFNDGPWTVHGVAQAAEVTEGVSGRRRYWPPDVLRDAAEELVEVPITDPDDHDNLDAGQPHPDIIIGEVTDAVFDEDRAALVYEGEIDDPERARQIARGRVDVSPSVALEPGDQHDGDRDAESVEAIVAYRDLAIVADGAHASASIKPGTAAALARHFDIQAEALQRERARRPVYNGTERSEWSTPTLEDYLRGYDSLPAPDEADSVADLTDDEKSVIADSSLLGSAGGDTLWKLRLFPVVSPGSGALNRRALGAVRSGRGEQADIPSDALASARRMAGRLLNEEFDADIEIEATSTGDDGPRDDSGSSTPDDDSLSDPLMDEITDAERELLAAARQLDDPTVVETRAAERLSDHDELIETATETDDPVVVSRPDYDALEARVDEVRDVLADALQAQTGLSETTIDAMPFEALAAEFDADDGALNIESLAQSPETGSGPSAPELSDDDRERKQEIEERLSRLDGEDSTLAEREMERLEGELETITNGGETA